MEQIWTSTLWIRYDSSSPIVLSEPFYFLSNLYLNSGDVLALLN